jgi:tetratricopeptide (TPR) repeat protein
MPSLNALGEFKSSFSNIGNEKKSLLAQNLEYDDYPLPTTEATPMDFTRTTGDTADSGGGDALDFSAYTSALPGDVSSLNEPPSIDDLFQDINEPSPDSDVQQSEGQEILDDFLKGLGPSTEEQTDAGTFAGDDFSTGEDSSADMSMDELLSGDTPDFETPADDFSGAGESADNSFDLDGGIDLGSEVPEPAEEPLDMGSEAFDLGGEASGDESFDLGGEAFDMGSEVPEPAEESLDMGSESFDLGGETPGDESFDLGGESFDMGSDVPEPAEESLEMGSESFDLGGETPGDESFDLGGESLDMGSEASEPRDESLDMGGDAFDLGGEAPEMELGSDFDSSLPDTDFPADSGFDTPDADFSSSSDFDVPDADFPAEGELTIGEEDSGSDGFDAQSLGDLGNEFASDSIELDSGAEQGAGLSSDGYSSGSFGDDEFALPGIEEIFEKSKSSAPAQPVEKKGLFKRKKVKAEDLPEAETDIEEIQLTQDDIDRILKTLASYPLNLRIVCEEMIVEQVLLPKQLAKLIFLLKNGANVRETAALAEEITGKPVVIPKSFEKMTGAAFEAEQASFAYIFIHNFLPVLRLFAVIALLAASVVYLGYRFIYIPIKAEGLYKRGYERIPAGEYQRENQLFHEAFLTHKKKKWFYLYAESFRDQRRYMLAEEKYDELLRYYPRDKKGVLDYASLNTYHTYNYEKANRLLQQQLLDYTPDDYDGLLAAGDNFLLWADSDPDRFYDRYEDARFSYARMIDNFGWQPPIIERMLKFFIRTDNLKEVLYLRYWFESEPKKRKLSTPSLAELGGYLLDKQLEEVKGVPDMYLESIESVRDMLLQAVRQEPTLPEPHYHLARYYKSLGNTYEERLTLENAIRAFDMAKTETVRRRLYRVDTHYRYASLLINNKEFFPAEEQLVKGIQLFEDFLARNLVPPSPQLGRLYSTKGDLEYFVKSGDMRAALTDYRLAERYGYAPPEIQYRMGAAYYQLQDWRNALEYLFKASAELPLNRRLLYAMGNAAYQRGDYFAAQGYYDRLLDILENQRIRLPVLMPNDNPQFLELGERLMIARNNMGVVYEALAEQTGNREYRSRAMALYAESSRAWDAITRNPETMIRSRFIDTPGAPSINLGYLNANNALRPTSSYRPEIFPRIDKDVIEPSHWEELAPISGLQ